MPILTPKHQWYRKAEHRKDHLNQKQGEYFCGPATGQRCNVVSTAEARRLLGSSPETEWLQASRSRGVETWEPCAQGQTEARLAAGRELTELGLCPGRT